MQRYFKDPVSGLTHLAGAFLGVAGLVFLLIRGIHQGNRALTVSFVVFGASLILLYSSSAFYHLLHLSEKNRLILRRIDHSMIFVLIAGTYAPFCLGPLHGPLGWTILGIEWGGVLCGFVLSVFWIHAPAKIRLAIYLAMGWMVVVALYPLSQALSVTGFTWLVAGGMFYSVGALIYAIKWPNPLPPHFGFHEIWHLLVLAGSGSHFLAVASLLEGPRP